MSFDEQPDGDPHGECAAEIHRLESERNDYKARALSYEAANAEQGKLLNEVIKERDELRKDAERYQELCVNPAGGAHLLTLLAAGKGTQTSLDNMIDRISESRRAAIAKSKP